MYAPITGTGDGSAPIVPLTFDYLSRSHVKASVNGADVAITFSGASEVTFSATVAAGAKWIVYRQTPSDAPLVDFTDGSVLTENDLDTATLQTLYVAQELDAHVDELIQAGLSINVAVADVAGLQDALDLKLDSAAFTTQLDAKADLSHTHTIDDVTGLQAALDAKADDAHTHVISDITGLQADLDLKLEAGDILAGPNVTVTNNGDGTVTIASAGGGGGGATLADGDYGDVLVGSSGTAMTVQTVGGSVPSFPGHTHTIANVTGLQTALDAKLASASFTWTNLSGKPATFPPSAHTHATSEVTGLDADLAAKADQTDVDAKADGLSPVIPFTGNKTIGGDSLGAYLIYVGGAGATVTLDGAVGDGFSMVLVNRGTAALPLAAAAGMYINATGSTVTSASLPIGGSVVLFHEGSGVWAVKGDAT